MIYLINFLLAVSATISMSLIPILCIQHLGFSLLAVGLIEGGSELLSSMIKILGGILFDRIQNKRLLFVASTLLAFLSKAVLFVSAPWAILFCKATDRISNGMFATPRDAYVGATAQNKGRAMGFLASSRSMGCVVGPMLVGIITYFFGGLDNNLDLFVGLTVLSSALAMVFSCFLKIPNSAIDVTPIDISTIKKVLKQTSPCLWIIFIFFLARFNDGVLMLYLKQQGFEAWFYISAIAIFNIFMVFNSLLIGRLVDKGLVKGLEIIAVGAMLMFCLVFSCVGQSYTLAVIGMLLWGIQRSTSQIVFDIQIMSTVEKKYYGTALGFLYFVSGLGTLLASTVCGWLAKFGYHWVFIWSGVISFTLMIIMSFKYAYPRISKTNPIQFGEDHL